MRKLILFAKNHKNYLFYLIPERTNTMKKMKKLLSVLLMLAMMVSLATASFAADEKGSITINNAVTEQIYKAYRILNLESYNSATNAYAYKANSAWETWLETQQNYVNIDASRYVTWVENADVSEFAKLAQAYASENSIEADATVTATSTTVKFENLDLGYYLVDTTLGTICSLDTTNPDVTMTEKNAAPENKKEVEEDSTGDYGEENDADLGQTVNFKSTITAQAGAENYVFHDKMSEGLTYTGVTSVKLNGTDVEEKYYEVTTTNTDYTFEITFSQEFCDTLKKDDKIVISYTATVNENAVIGLPGNPNESSLSYGDSSNVKTTPASKTTTYVWDLDVLKYANGVESNVLADAEFVLLNSNKTKVATVVNGKFTGWVDIPSASADGSIAWPENTVLTTGTNGKIEIDGLDSDDYYIREVKAPAGFNKLASDVEVSVTGKTTEGDQAKYDTVIAKINNQSGTELPSTGGIGTVIFYVVGGVLVLAAVVFFVTKKRMSAK